MSTVNYQIRDNRYVPISGLSYTGTILNGNTVTIGPIGTANFATIAQEVQTDGQVNIGLRFSNDTVTWSAYSSNETGLTADLVVLNTTVLGTYATLRIENASGSSVAVNIVSYGSMIPVAATEQDTFRTIDDPIQVTDPLLLTKGIISGSLPGTGISNVNLIGPGTLEVGEYNSSMLQRTAEPVFYGTLPKNLSAVNIGNYSGTNTTSINASNGSVLTSTGLTILETSFGTKYGSINDTFVLRFNAIFTSGDSFITFGDQYVGIGVSSGTFCITYMSGNVSQVYTEALNLVTLGTSTSSFSLGGTAFSVPGISNLTGPRVTMETMSNNVPFEVYYIKDTAFFRRVGPAVNSVAASVSGNTTFYSGQPSVVSGTFGVTNIILASAFNIDHMDGTGYLPAINPANGVSGELVFTADGNMMLMITDPRNGSLSPVHRAKVNDRIFTGDHSRISVRTNIASVTIYDASIYGHPTKIDGPLSYSYSASSYWPTNPANANGFLFLANIARNNKSAKITKITVTMNCIASVYLLKNTIMLPIQTIDPYTTTDISISPLLDNLWQLSCNTYGVSAATTDKYFNQVIAQGQCNSTGTVVFEDPPIDYFDAITVGYNPGNYVGSFTYSIKVDYGIQ